MDQGEESWTPNNQDNPQDAADIQSCSLEEAHTGPAFNGPQREQGYRVVEQKEQVGHKQFVIQGVNQCVQSQKQQSIQIGGDNYQLMDQKEEEQEVMQLVHIKGLGQHQQILLEQERLMMEQEKGQHAFVDKQGMQVILRPDQQIVLLRQKLFQLEGEQQVMQLDQGEQMVKLKSGQHIVQQQSMKDSRDIEQETGQEFYGQHVEQHNEHVEHQQFVIQGCTQRFHSQNQQFPHMLGDNYQLVEQVEREQEGQHMVLKQEQGVQVILRPDQQMMMHSQQMIQKGEQHLMQLEEGGKVVQQSTLDCLAGLIRDAPRTVANVLLLAFEQSKSSEILSSWNSGNHFSTHELTATLAWLTNANDVGEMTGWSKSHIANQVLLALKALLPSTCSHCKIEYCVLRSDIPSLRCSSCSRGVHEACLRNAGLKNLFGDQEDSLGTISFTCRECTYKKPLNGTSISSSHEVAVLKQEETAKIEDDECSCSGIPNIGKPVDILHPYFFSL